MFEFVGSEILATIMRAVTGRLYTEEQIKRITSGAIGRYFSGFFPTPKEELAVQARVQSAHDHIAAAGTIIRDMRDDLEAENAKLSQLLVDVEQKKQLADRYQALAATNRKAFDAFRAEMEEALRKELHNQAERGRRVRQIISIIIWLTTLLAGAALGSYFQDIVKWIKGA